MSMSAFQTKALPALQIETVALLASSSVLYFPLDTTVQPRDARARSWAALGPAFGAAACGAAFGADVAAEAMVGATMIGIPRIPIVTRAIRSRLRTGASITKDCQID